MSVSEWAADFVAPPVLKNTPLLPFGQKGGKKKFPPGGKIIVTELHTRGVWGFFSNNPPKFAAPCEL